MIRMSSLARAGFGLGLLLLLVFTAGFFAFCATLPRAGEVSEARLAGVPAEARGIVVLTGDGGPRIEKGLELQTKGLGARVLISGVHPRTTKNDLAAMGPKETLACCVDLGPWAKTTRGNAIESRDWIRSNGYETVLLVTSDFHLPRATVELRHSAPGVEVVGVPVASNLAPETGWMDSPQAWRLLATEYAKYLFVRIRSFF